MISEYATVKVQYNDPACIKQSLKELGYIFEEHSVAQRLYGYQGDLRQQVANIIVRRAHVGPAANDVGFHKTKDGKYELLISEFDRRKGSTSECNFLHKLKQLYTKHKMVKKLKNMGKTITSIKVKDGRIKIKARG